MNNAAGSICARVYLRTYVFGSPQCMRTSGIAGTRGLTIKLFSKEAVPSCLPRSSEKAPGAPSLDPRYCYSLQPPSDEVAARGSSSVFLS